MLMSTLPVLAGKIYDVRGVVFSNATLGAIGGGNLEKMFKTIAQQAINMGADAIIDLKVTAPGGEYGIVVITGTAVKIS